MCVIFIHIPSLELASSNFSVYYKMPLYFHLRIKILSCTSKAECVLQYYTRSIFCFEQTTKISRNVVLCSSNYQYYDFQNKFWIWLAIIGDKKPQLPKILKYIYNTDPVIGIHQLPVSKDGYMWIRTEQNMKMNNIHKKRKSCILITYLHLDLPPTLSTHFCFDHDNHM